MIRVRAGQKMAEAGWFEASSSRCQSDDGGRLKIGNRCSGLGNNVLVGLQCQTRCHGGVRDRLIQERGRVSHFAENGNHSRQGRAGIPPPHEHSCASVDDGDRLDAAGQGRGVALVPNDVNACIGAAHPLIGGTF